MTPYELDAGELPLLISMPHNGTTIPDTLLRRMTGRAARVPDTDWNVDRLYAFAGELGAYILKPTYSRYVVDLNRAPDDTVLYPGASNTEVCPTSCFDETPIYSPGEAPRAPEIEERIETYWRPYHGAIERTLGAIRARHGIALLFEGHSIRSRVPRFFDGTLPDLNLGTVDGRSCAGDLEERLVAVLESHRELSHVVNGRFKGGYITRRYGNPDAGIHAVQLELSQATYMDEEYPFTYREDLAATVIPVLRDLIETLLDWAGAA